ncbi:MAG: permease, partial [Bacilli bacterium]|nr:permease [Bacilli bacterium]
MDAVKGIWDFISSQILGMKWLNVSVGKLLSFIGGDFTPGTWQNTAIDALHFFIYDFIKIGILLCVLIFSVSYIQSYFPPEKTKRILGKYKGIGANF